MENVSLGLLPVLLQEDGGGGAPMEGADTPINVFDAHFFKEGCGDFWYLQPKSHRRTSK